MDGCLNEHLEKLIYIKTNSLWLQPLTVCPLTFDVSPLYTYRARHYICGWLGWEEYLDTQGEKN